MRWRLLPGTYGQWRLGLHNRIFSASVDRGYVEPLVRPPYWCYYASVTLYGRESLHAPEPFLKEAEARRWCEAHIEPQMYALIPEVQMIEIGELM